MTLNEQLALMRERLARLAHALNKDRQPEAAMQVQNVLVELHELEAVVAALEIGELPCD